MNHKLILKLCTKCEIPKPLEEFYWRNKSTGLRRSECKECVSKHSKQYYIKNKKKILVSTKQYYTSNKKRLLKSRKLQRQTNKEKILEYNKQYRENNKEKISINGKKYYQNNKDSIKYGAKLYRENNKKSILEHNKQYRIKNEKYLKKYRKQYRKNNRLVINEWFRNKRIADPIFKLNNCISGQIRKALRHNKSGRSWEILVGYTLLDLKLHLEKLFAPDMSWENYGEWHIDHCTPVSWFKKTEKELLKAWKLDNLQPMWSNENLVKGNRWESPRIVTVLK